MRRVATPESPPQVTLIVVDFVFLQQLQILFLKSLLPVMFALVPDVFNNIRNLGLANCEPAVAVLPFKATQLGKLFVNPLRRIAFQILGDLTRAMLAGPSRERECDLRFLQPEARSSYGVERYLRCRPRRGLRFLL